MDVTRILAPNAGTFTGPGTNTYLVGSAGRWAVIDPGPVSESHLESILGLVRGRDPVAVLVTHTHSDHAPLANPLARRLGVPAYGFAPGPGFLPDRELADGEAVELGEERLVALHTPGHSRDHLCYLAGETLFTGDHVMGGSTVVVEDMTSYLESLRRLLEVPIARILPGHGEEIDEPRQELLRYLEHRLERERQVMEAVHRGASTVGEVVDQVYERLAPELRRLAAFSAFAHLRKLEEEGRVGLSGGEPPELASEAADRLWDVGIELRSEGTR